MIEGADVGRTRDQFGSRISERYPNDVSQIHYQDSALKVRKVVSAPTHQDQPETNPTTIARYQTDSYATCVVSNILIHHGLFESHKNYSIPPITIPEEIDPKKYAGIH